MQAAFDSFEQPGTEPMPQCRGTFRAEDCSHRGRTFTALAVACVTVCATVNGRVHHETARDPTISSRPSGATSGRCAAPPRWIEQVGDQLPLLN